jgi:hypothetical protein
VLCFALRALNAVDLIVLLAVHEGNKFDRRAPTPGGKNGGYAYVYDCTIIFRKRLERIV